MPMRFEASGVPVAAQVHVAVALHERDLEGAQRVDVVVERGVGVPGGEEAGAVGVEEDEGGGEAGVVVDDVGEVGHGFAAFVHGGREGGGGVVAGGGINGVDCCLPAVVESLAKAMHGMEVWLCVLGQLLCYPVRIFLLRLGHDDDLVAGLDAKGWDVLHGPMLEGVFPRMSEVGRYAVLVPDVFYFDLDN